MRRSLFAEVDARQHSIMRSTKTTRATGPRRLTPFEHLRPHLDLIDFDAVDGFMAAWRNSWCFFDNQGQGQGQGRDGVPFDSKCESTRQCPAFDAPFLDGVHKYCTDLRASAKPERLDKFRTSLRLAARELQAGASSAMSPEACEPLAQLEGLFNELREEALPRLPSLTSRAPGDAPVEAQLAAAERNLALSADQRRLIREVRKGLPRTDDGSRPYDLSAIVAALDENRLRGFVGAMTYIAGWAPEQGGQFCPMLSVSADLIIRHCSKVASKGAGDPGLRQNLINYLHGAMTQQGRPRKTTATATATATIGNQESRRTTRRRTTRRTMLGGWSWGCAALAGLAGLVSLTFVAGAVGALVFGGPLGLAVAIPCLIGAVYFKAEAVSWGVDAVRSPPPPPRWKRTTVYLHTSRPATRRAAPTARQTARPATARHTVAHRRPYYSIYT